MRVIREKFWTKNFGPMGHPKDTLGPIWPLTVVLGNFFLVILNTYGMVYITLQFIALDNFFAKELASAVMCTLISEKYLKFASEDWGY